jgi:NADH-quinone oxidoreductase subunit L
MKSIDTSDNIDKTLEKHLSNVESSKRYLEKWESRSSIRSRPKKYIDFNQEGYFFPEDKQPLLLNQDIINMGQKIKEEILLAAFHSNKIVYAVALFTSGLTAFYMFRLYFRIFWNKEPAHAHHSNEHGEGSWNMKFPLLLLAVAAVVVGFIPFSHYVSFNGRGEEMVIPVSFSIAPVAMAIGGIALAYWLYYKENPRPQQLAAALGGLYRAARQKFYFDELYLFVTKKIIVNGIAKPAAWIDKNIVDGCMNGLGLVTTLFSERIKALQSGSVQNYTLYFFGGVIALAAVFIYWWK